MIPQVSRRHRLGKWLRAQSPWPFIAFLLLLTAVVFCVLWLKDSAPAELLPEWISALATTGALVAAGIAAWAAYAQLRQLRIESFQREQARIARHARAVFFEDVPPQLVSGTDEVAAGRLTIYNSGPEPVTNVQAHYRTPGGFATWNLYGVLIPTGSDGADVGPFNDHLAERVSTWINAEIPVPRGAATWGLHPYVLVLTFRDSEGRHWLKTGDTAMCMIPEGIPLHEIFPHSPLSVEEWMGPVGKGGNPAQTSPTE
jgi:hypothetical protein